MIEQVPNSLFGRGEIGASGYFTEPTTTQVLFNNLNKDELNHARLTSILRFRDLPIISERMDTRGITYKKAYLELVSENII
jgi:hypothetical protein